ncbi:MAG: DUF6145 family protein [Johnsonella sp.]|nr:DUF6145 family protein [Johnsonella sp.]
MDEKIFDDLGAFEEKEGIVICAANSYQEKYYFNPLFRMLPNSVKDELKILCVSFTEKAGGILALSFDREGSLQFKVMVSEGDYLFDEIESGILISHFQRKKKEILEEVELFYKVLFLGKEVS